MIRNTPFGVFFLNHRGVDLKTKISFGENSFWLLVFAL
jgi:hypothetical protein